MESEKVKEIKELLLRKAKEYESQTLLDILTLINELESENERLNKSDTSKEESSIEYYNLYKDFKRENQQLKDRIAELENENVKQLKQFAERLKEKFDEQKYFYETASISHRNISLTALNTAYRCLDETLKEYVQ